jgi:N4-gp56 family major capsid protein
MADYYSAGAITQSSSLTTDQVAFEKLAYFALRPELYFDQFADVQATNATNPGASIKFTIFNDMAAVTSALSETEDVTPVAMSDSQVTVTLNEYGNATVTTAKLRASSFLPVDPVAANAVGYNAGLSIDTICSDVLKAGSNVIYATGGTDTATARVDMDVDDTLTAKDVRRAVAQLRGANVPTINGNYVGFIHPDVSYDLRGITDASGWRDSYKYTNAMPLYNGEIGMFEGVRFMESSRAPIFANAFNGSGSAGTGDSYATLIMGAQALAKGISLGGEYGAQPSIVYGNITDLLKRFRPVGWKHFVGYGVFRQAALRRIESASSIGANAS